MMEHRNMPLRFFSMALSFSVAAGLCLSPASVFAAEERNAAAQILFAEGESRAETVTAGQYVLMNIPYADFYKAELTGNEIPVDAYTSATLNKSRTKSLVDGSYHVDPDGKDVTGITYPVKIGEGVDLGTCKQVTDEDSVTITVTNRGTTTTSTYTGRDALFENESYAYYVLNETPDNYKEVTIGADGKFSFGKAEGKRESVDGVKAELTTESSYGDYQMELEGLTLSSDTAIYGVALETKEGASYGLRHMENIWRQVNLAWCTGFTDAIHGCPTSSKHYEAMMGQTLTKVVYYTSEGIKEIPVGELYVPKKFTYTMKVEDALVTAGTTAVSLEGLPEDYEASYSVEGLEGVAVSGSTLVYDQSKAAKGNYTLTVTDTKGAYAKLSAGFQLYVEDMPAAYAPAEKSLVAAEGYTASDLADFISSIESVTVNGEAYAASGRGSVTIINQDGTLKTDAEPISANGSYEMSVAAATYHNPLKFTYHVSDTSALEEAVKKAEALTQSDYTEESWKALADSLAAAEALLQETGSQDAVDQAAGQLNKAIEALVGETPAPETPKTKPSAGTTYTYQNVKYKVLNSSSVTAQAAGTKNIKKVKIPAAVEIDGYSFKVTAVAKKAFSGCGKVTSVSIGKNVASIGNQAFQGCTALKKATVSSTALTKIGNSAFQGCTAMTSFTAQSAKLASIGNKAFYGDKKLAAVSLKTAKLTKSAVGANAFKNIKATCTFKVPAKKVSAYGKIFKAKGAGQKIKVKKI